jgi:hypothetical protein
MTTELSAFVRRSAHTVAVTYVETYIVFAVLRVLAPASVHTMVLVAALTACVLSFVYARLAAFVRRLLAMHRVRHIVIHVHLTDASLAVRPAQHSPKQPG